MIIGDFNIDLLKYEEHQQRTPTLCTSGEWGPPFALQVNGAGGVPFCTLVNGSTFCTSGEWGPPFALQVNGVPPLHFR